MKIVADYHFSAKTVSRAEGRSSTAAAAYRSGSLITDERTGEIHDYRRKGGVEWSSIVLPSGGTMERSELWNAVEIKHKRGDAVVAREFEVGIPHELNAPQRARLIEQYCRELADSYGVAVDANIHEPSRDGDQRNFHAHILLSACYCDEDGTLGKKAVELDPIHCARAKIGNAVETQRARWKKLANEALAEAGFSTRIDHRSLIDQGIADRAPGVHLGPSAHAIHMRGEISEVHERAFAQAQEFIARAQADAAIQAAAERDIAELEQELAKLKAEAAELAKYQPKPERHNAYFTHTAEPNFSPTSTLSRHGLRVLSECRLAHNECGRSESVLQDHARADRRELEVVRREPEPTRLETKEQIMQDLEPLKAEFNAAADVINKGHEARKIAQPAAVILAAGKAAPVAKQRAAIAASEVEEIDGAEWWQIGLQFKKALRGKKLQEEAERLKAEAAELARVAKLPAVEIIEKVLAEKMEVCDGLRSQIEPIQQQLDQIESVAARQKALEAAIEEKRREKAREEEKARQRVIYEELAALEKARPKSKNSQLANARDRDGPRGPGG
jgi:hypothetical protein